MNSFTDILHEFGVGFKQRCIPFWIFFIIYFIESLSIITIKNGKIWFSDLSVI